MEQISTVFDQYRLAYFSRCFKDRDLDLAMEFVEKIVEAERLNLAYRLDDIENRIEKLEQVQVTRQEFDELKARVERIAQTQRSITEVVIRI